LGYRKCCLRQVTIIAPEGAGFNGEAGDAGATPSMSQRTHPVLN